MQTLSVVLLSVWLGLVGAVWATWVTITQHNLGVVTFVVGLAILLIELYFWNRGGRKPIVA